MGKHDINYSVYSEFKCYFEFFRIILIVIGIFWCRDAGIVGGKMQF